MVVVLRPDAVVMNSVHTEAPDKTRQIRRSNYLLWLMSDRAAPHPCVLELHHELLVQAVAEVFSGWSVIVKYYRSSKVCRHSLGLRGGAVEELREGRENKVKHKIFSIKIHQLKKKEKLILMILNPFQSLCAAQI